MDIQAIKTEVIEAATVFYGVLKNVAVWGGHQFQVGYTNYLVPTVKALWSLGSQGLNVLKTGFTSGSSTVFGVAGGLFVLGIAAFKIADCKANDENACAMTTWKALGIIAFIGATVATGVGISALAVV